MTEALAPRLVSRSDDHPRVQRGIGRAPLQRIIDAVAEVFSIATRSAAAEEAHRA
jgi:hypothetical protein